MTITVMPLVPPLILQVDKNNNNEYDTDKSEIL